MKNEKRILTRLKELAEFFPPETIEPAFNEIFENNLRCTTQSGEPLALQYFLMNEVKAILNDVSKSINHKKQNTK
jgi:hypothetical protein